MTAYFLNIEDNPDIVTRVRRLTAHEWTHIDTPHCSAVTTEIQARLFWQKTKIALEPLADKIESNDFVLIWLDLKLFTRNNEDLILLPEGMNYRDLLRKAINENIDRVEERHKFPGLAMLGLFADALDKCNKCPEVLVFLASTRGNPPDETVGQDLRICRHNFSVSRKLQKFKGNHGVETDFSTALRDAENELSSLFHNIHDANHPHQASFRPLDVVCGAIREMRDHERNEARKLTHPGSETDANCLLNDMPVLHGLVQLRARQCGAHNSSAESIKGLLDFTDTKKGREDAVLRAMTQFGDWLRLTQRYRSCVVGSAPEGFVPMIGPSLPFIYLLSEFIERLEKENPILEIEPSREDTSPGVIRCALKIKFTHKSHNLNGKELALDKLEPDRKSHGANGALWNLLYPACYQQIGALAKSMLVPMFVCPTRTIRANGNAVTLSWSVVKNCSLEIVC